VPAHPGINQIPVPKASVPRGQPNLNPRPLRRGTHQAANVDCPRGRLDQRTLTLGTRHNWDYRGHAASVAGHTPVGSHRAAGLAQGPRTRKVAQAGTPAVSAHQATAREPLARAEVTGPTGACAPIGGGDGITRDESQLFTLPGHHGSSAQPELALPGPVGRRPGETGDQEPGCPTGPCAARHTLKLPRKAACETSAPSAGGVTAAGEGAGRWPPCQAATERPPVR